MRFFTTFPIALNEIRRELKEMGIRVHTKSVQNLDITNDDSHSSLEIQNYTYTVTEPDVELIPLANPDWVLAEFGERIGPAANPGEAWKLRRAYWEKFLRPDGKFDYTYPERFSASLEDVIQALKQDINTRRAFLPMIDIAEDVQCAFDLRFPCTIGYWLHYRQGKLHLTYLQRSADFSEHFNNDICLANMMKNYIAAQLNVEPGYYCHWIGSLHIFAKDVEGVF